MLFAATVDTLTVHPDQCRIIVSVFPVNVKTVGVFSFFKSAECFGYAAFCSLQLVGNGDTPTIIPHRYGHGDFQYGGSIQRFEKMTFGSGGIADGAESYLITVAGKLFGFFQCAEATV